MAHNTPVDAGSTMQGETKAENTQRLRPAQKPLWPTWRRCRGLPGCCLGLRVCEFPFSICSGAFDSNPELPVSPCRSRSLRQAEVWNSKPGFSVAKVWPPSVEWFLQYHWKGCNCPVRWGPLVRKRDAVVSLFQTGTCRVSKAFRGKNGETQKLSGNSEIKTFAGYPNYSCGLILQTTALEMGCEADGSIREHRRQFMFIEPSLLPGLLNTASITSFNLHNNPLRWVL